MRRSGRADAGAVGTDVRTPGDAGAGRLLESGAGVGVRSPQRHGRRRLVAGDASGDERPEPGAEERDAAHPGPIAEQLERLGRVRDQVGEPDAAGVALAGPRPAVLEPLDRDARPGEPAAEPRRTTVVDRRVERRAEAHEHAGARRLRGQVPAPEHQVGPAEQIDLLTHRHVFRPDLVVV